MEALHGVGGFTLENKVVAHRLHAEHADFVFEQDRQDSSFETVEVRVHYVERHLDSIKREPMLCSGIQHLQMDLRTLVASEADVADLACLLRL